MLAGVGRGRRAHEAAEEEQGEDEDEGESEEGFERISGVLSKGWAEVSSPERERESWFAARELG